MKSLWFKLILVATIAVSGNPLSLAQTPEQLYQKGEERIEKKGNAEATQLQKTNVPKWKQPHLDRIGTASSRGRSPTNAFLGEEDASTDQITNGEPLILTGGTHPILQSVLQSLKMTGISLIVGGILAILIIYLLIMLIMLLRVSLSDKRMS